MSEKCEGDCKSCLSGGEKLSYKNLGVLALLVFVFSFGLMALKMNVVAKAEEQTDVCYTREEVSRATETMDKCLTIYDDKVYDFTSAKKWDLTGHVGQHLCGAEYDKATIEAGPHKVSVMDKFEIGRVCGEGEVGAVMEEASGGWGNWSVSVLGMSWFRLTAYLSLVFFLLNFLTCYAMPWAKVRQPWEGARPGKDKMDTAGRFPLTHLHKWFAWLAVFWLGVHGVLGFLQVWFGIYL